MKLLTYILIILGSLFVAYIFLSFTANLSVYSYNLQKPISDLTESERSFLLMVRIIMAFIGACVGFFAFKHILRD